MTPTVTMHAIVRYLERKHGLNVKRLCANVRRSGDPAVVNELVAKHGFDIDAVKAEMLAPPVVEAFEAGARAVKYAGVRYLFGNGKIVTVTPTASPPVRRG